MIVGGAALRIEDVAAVAEERAEVVLDPGVAARLAASRRVVELWAARDTPAYGLTTGLGAAVDTALRPEDMAAFQGRAIRARAVGIGPFLPVAEVRAAMLVRLAGLARGASGITPGFAETFRDMLNRGVHPRMRRTGSLGEADLAPLAAMALPLAGDGEADLDGQILPGPEALRAAGIRVPALGPKDAIALLNSNAASVGAGALVLRDFERVFDALTLAGALSLEGFRANLSVLDPRVVALRPAPGQAAMSERLLGLLAGSDLLAPGAARRVQDPLSFRCLAPVHGVVALRLADARAAVEADLSGAGDSPAVLADTGEILSGAGFDTTAIALAFEAVGQAASHAAAISASRIARLMSPSVSGLPRFLAAPDGVQTGFATAQKSAAALEAEIRHLALPLGAATMPVADGVEDYAPMTPRIVEKTAAIGHRLARLAAIELVVAAAAIDLRPGIRLGSGPARAHCFVRARVPPFSEDRRTGEEFERVAEALAGGGLAP